MSQTRVCGACQKPIYQVVNLEVTLRVVETNGAEVQDALTQSYDDYCNHCVQNGAAVGDLLKGLQPKYRRKLMRKPR